MSYRHYLFLKTFSVASKLILGLHFFIQTLYIYLSKGYKKTIIGYNFSSGRIFDFFGSQKSMLHFCLQLTIFGPFYPYLIIVHCSSFYPPFRELPKDKYFQRNHIFLVEVREKNFFKWSQHL